MQQQFQVRPGRPDEFDAVARLCIRAREESLVGSQLCSNDVAALVRQIAVLSALPGGELYVLHADDGIAGFMLLRTLSSDLLHDGPTLYIEALYIAQGFRRQGAGHALMATAAHRAEQAGASDIYSQPLPGSRGTQRFLARMGFAPAAAHRVVSTAALLRALGGDGKTRRSPARSLEELIARRRRSRGEHPASASGRTGSAPLPPSGEPEALRENARRRGHALSGAASLRQRHRVG